MEEKALTLRDELREHKAISHTASFQFLTDHIYFFTTALYGLPNITLQFPQEQSLRRASGGEGFKSVR